MENNYSGHVATIHLTINGQNVDVKLIALGGHIEGYQTSTYYRYGKIGRSGYGGYESGRIHFASTRTIANAIERYIKTNY